MQFEIDEVLQEKRGWAMVRWAGYHPSWEAWRLPGWEGQPGDPVVTWERKKWVRSTAAGAAWLAGEEHPP